MDLYLRKEIEEINNNFKNLYLNHVQVLTNNDFLFLFSKSSLGGIFLSFNSTFPFIKIVRKKYCFSINNISISKIKNKILNSKFLGCEIINDDNVILLKFLKVNETYDRLNYNLYVELFKTNYNIVLTLNNKIVEVLHAKSLETKRPIMIGMNYLLPNKIFSLKKEENENDQLNKINSYLLSIESIYLKNKYGYIKKTIDAKIKSLNHKIENLNNDKNNALNKLVYKDLANFLLTNFDEFKYEKHIIFENKDYKLNESISLNENIQKLFKQYKKAKQTILFTTNLIDESAELIDYFKSIIEKIDFYNEDDYLDLIEELSNKNIIKKSKKVKTNTPNKNKPYYIIYNGTKIGFGKTSYQNDYLTFKLANKNNYFLHINKSFGSHVIIFSSSPNLKQKELASEIAIYLSKNSLGEVIYTQVKNLKKGKESGLVLFNKYETFTIKNFKFEIKEILNEAKRF